MTKVKQEGSFVIHWILSKCGENFQYFALLKSAKESHCLTEYSSEKLSIHQKAAKISSHSTFVAYSILQRDSRGAHTLYP